MPAAAFEGCRREWRDWVTWMGDDPWRVVRVQDS